MLGKTRLILGAENRLRTKAETDKLFPLLLTEAFRQAKALPEAATHW